MSFVAAVEDAERAQLIADLKAARAELVARGRCLGVPVAADGRVCILGALGVAIIDGFVDINNEDDQYVALDAVRVSDIRTLFEARIFPRWAGVSFFNDDYATTDQDVLDLFDKTLADLGGLA